MKKEISEIIDFYYKDNPKAKEILITHSEMVMLKCISIIEKHPELNADRETLIDAALLHDIGIIKTDAPKIECFGSYPYLMHGVLGRKIIEQSNLKHLAMFAERHTGTGISKEDIIENNLPLPQRDMIPITIEEQILCFADLFYSKGKGKLRDEKSVEKIRAGLLKFGQSNVDKFDSWCNIFQ